MENFLQTEIVIIEMLLVVAVVAIVVRRLSVPYTVALVIVGLIISLQQPIEFRLTPELILALFVPPLVFEAAFHLRFNDLRRNLVTLLLMVIPGVVITMLIVGGMLAVGNVLTLPLAMVFGALIAATDPISVVVLFRELGVPKRLSVLMEGESLLNDGTAIVVFNIMMVVALEEHFQAASAAANFIQVAIGGTAVGLILGWIISRIIARVDDYLIETTLTTVLAFGSYLVAEQLHFSGVLAVVAAGLINGNISPQTMSPTSRIVIINFWENIAFLANSLIFLLIGLEINLSALLKDWQPILWAVGAVLLARVVVVYGLSLLVNRITDSPIPFRWQHIIGWGGLRGAISLALALSLPAALGGQRELLQVMTFGVVLFTLLVQAPTMRPLVKWLKVVTRTEGQVEYEMRHARLTAARASEKHLTSLHSQGLVSSYNYEKLKTKLDERIHSLAGAVREVLHARPELGSEEMDTAYREILRAQRSALQGLQRDGVISQEVFENLGAEVDAQLINETLTMQGNDNDLKQE